MRPDYQSTLGFELVELEPKDDADHFYPDCVVREDGADDREATRTERVLWDSLIEALEALSKLTTEAWPYLTAKQREEAQADRLGGVPRGGGTAARGA